jgi:putative spermidine/putrescine transport system permease protein
VEQVPGAPATTLRTAAPIRQSWVARHPWVLLCSPALALSVILIGSLMILLMFSFFTYHRGRIIEEASLGSWVRVLGDPFFWDILGRSVTLAATVTLLNLLVGYPAAYAITKLRHPVALGAAYLLIFSPLVVSIVVRSYGWLLLLSEDGVLNFVLRSIHLIDTPLRLIFNLTGVQIAMVHGYMPFIVFPLVGVMNQVQGAYKEAAMDLGAGRIETFFRVSLPLSLPGIIAGCQIIFTLAVSAFVTPVLLGGGRVLVTSRLAWDDVTQLDWPRGAIEVFALLGVTVTVVLLSNVLARFTYLGHSRSTRA